MPKLALGSMLGRMSLAKTRAWFVVIPLSPGQYFVEEIVGEFIMNSCFSKS